MVIPDESEIMNASAPAPPSIKSLPGPPLITSFPPPPFIRSLPVFP